MGFRVRGLDEIDPLSVALPYGTEVTTRVDRLVGTRRIPQGALGRVVGQRGDTFDVQVVGVGVAPYRREELVARKLGQLRFARRRHAAWGALGGCVVLETVVGSRAWGLAGEGSDVDRRGVFVLPFRWTVGLARPPEELVSADGSATFWEIEKFCRQGLRADPNALETLFVAGARALDPMGEWTLAARDAFVSAQIYGSFGRYALSQLRKLAQSLRLAEHRRLVLEWLREEPPPGLDALAARLARAARVEAPTEGDAVLLAKEYVKQLYRSLHDQGLLAACDFAALAHFAKGSGAAFDLPRELRPKNAYNLLRLIATAVHWLETGSPELQVPEPLRGRLLAIKRGEVPLADVLREAEALTPALEAARGRTPLPRTPDVAAADALLRRIREESARRWAAGAEGAFGRDQPEPPAIEWEHE